MHTVCECALNILDEFSQRFLGLRTYVRSKRRCFFFRTSFVWRMSSVTCLQNNQFALNHDAWRTTNLFQMLEFWAFSSLWPGPIKVEVTHVILKSTVSQFMDGKALFITTRVLDDLMIQCGISSSQSARVLECWYLLTSLSAKPLKLSTVIHWHLWHLARFVVGGEAWWGSQILLLQQLQNCENRCLTCRGMIKEHIIYLFQNIAKWIKTVFPYDFIKRIANSDWPWSLALGPNAPAPNQGCP